MQHSQRTSIQFSPLPMALHFIAIPVTWQSPKIDQPNPSQDTTLPVNSWKHRSLPIILNGINITFYLPPLQIGTTFFCLITVHFSNWFDFLHEKLMKLKFCRSQIKQVLNLSTLRKALPLSLQFNDNTFWLLNTYFSSRDKVPLSQVTDMYSFCQRCTTEFHSNKIYT